MSGELLSPKEEKDRYRRNEEDPRVLELFCGVCFQYLGVIHCAGCHENFTDGAAKQAHVALTGGCRFPGNAGLSGGEEWWLNDVGSVQWESWHIPKKEERKNRRDEEDL